MKMLPFLQPGRDYGVPCVENMYCEEDEVPGCGAELPAVDSTLMSPQIPSKMGLNRNTFETRLCVGHLADCLGAEGNLIECL